MTLLKPWNIKRRKFSWYRKNTIRFGHEFSIASETKNNRNIYFIIPKKNAICFFDNKVEFIDDLNSKQLYKTHGFSRKRTLTIPQLQEDIQKWDSYNTCADIYIKRCCISVLYVDPINIHIELVNIWTKRKCKGYYFR
jgi:hypothetical protein